MRSPAKFSTICAILSFSIASVSASEYEGLIFADLDPIRQLQLGFLAECLFDEDAGYRYALDVGDTLTCIETIFAYQASLIERAYALAEADSVRDARIERFLAGFEAGIPAMRYVTHHSGVSWNTWRRVMARGTDFHGATPADPETARLLAEIKRAMAPLLAPPEHSADSPN